MRKESPATRLPQGGPHLEVIDAPDGYANLTRIDQGGFAVVYRGLDTRFDRTVALKILTSDTLNERQLQRFNVECLAAGRLSSHPNIVTVYGAGTTAGNRPWLAMEYCSGGSLAHRLAGFGPLPVAEVISIGALLCGALGAAHAAGILHRDIKPHNVLLTSYGEPALADFGIARVVNEDGTGCVTHETAAYTVVHAAPEILEGRTGTAAADVYSLGSTLYTLLAGQAPFAREASIGLAPLVTRILRNDLPVIERRGVPPELERLLRTSMSAQPRDRPTSIELGASLTSLGRRLASGEIVLPDAAEVPVTRAPQISPRRLLAILGGAAVLLAAASMTWGLGARGAGPNGTTQDAVAARAGQAAAAPARYNPTGLSLAQGKKKGELILSWNMPVRPDVVATVIYQGPGATRPRAVTNYDSGPDVTPHTTMRGLPSGRRVCLSATHVVSIDDTVTSAASPPICAVPR
jgi:hypothetical protein